MEHRRRLDLPHPTIERFTGQAIDAADRTALVNYLGGGTISSTTPTLRPVVGIVAASPYAQWR